MARASLLILMCLVAACDQRDAETGSPVSGLRIDTVLGEEGDAGFSRAVQPVPFEFPADHGAHNTFRSEWWYLTGALKDADGREYGLHYTLFRQALAPAPTGAGPWQTAQAYLAHLALTDVANRQHHEAERFARGHPGLAGVQVNQQAFKATIEDWQMTGTVDPGLSLVLDASSPGEFGLQVSVVQSEAVVQQGVRGYSEKGEGSASYYYSMPRLELAGTLVLEGNEIEVEGLGWLDREWSTSLLGDHLEGWDWFALHLDDQRSIMAFQLRRADRQRDRYDHGLLIDHASLPEQPVVHHENRGVRLLKPAHFELLPLRYFQDDQGTRWPVEWALKLNDETLRIRAMLDDQRMDLSIIYWEGLVEVLDADGQRTGQGYMELTGYGQRD